MAGTPWVYFVPYQSNFDEVLDALRQREFEAGRYYPASPNLPLIIDETTRAPGRMHESIEEAVMAAMPSGTSSILDILGVSDEQSPFFARRLDEEELKHIFDTPRPTRALVAKDLAMLDDVDRGEAVCFSVYDPSGSLSEICFAGYSFD